MKTHDYFLKKDSEKERKIVETDGKAGKKQ